MPTDHDALVPVPLLDLKAQHETLRDEIEPVVREVIESQWFIMGPKVESFEQAVGDYLGVTHAIGCASGSDAILLALMALGIGPGDEVICPTYTFFSTAGSIHRLGAVPVFCDIEPDSYNIDLDHLRRLAARCTRLRAIMPVHLFGRAADLDAVEAIAAEHGAVVIEDAAQAIGATDARGDMVGRRGAVSCFSFFPSKNLGGYGDGGLVTTEDDALAELLRDLRNHGMRPKYHHHAVGLNSRLDALQAAVLEVKLRHLEAWHAGRAANAADYDGRFTAAGAADSTVPLSAGGFQLRTPAPAPAPMRHVRNQYVIRVPAAIRDELRAHLAERKIFTEIYYPVPLHRQACFAKVAAAQGLDEGSLPESERAAAETLALPIYPELTGQQRTRVAETIIAFVGEHAPAGEPAASAAAG